MGTFKDSREFIRGAARESDLVYILSKGKALVEQDIAHTSAICVDRSEWADGADTHWDSTALAVARLPSVKLVFIGQDGEVCTYVGGKSTKEQLKPKPVMIRNANTIDGLVVACGMSRQVYVRTGDKKWRDISVPSQLGDNAGFEAVDGYSIEELYAVGWRGEIWRYDGATWSACESDTDVILSAVCCAGDGVVYAAGQHGVLLRGRGNAFERIAVEAEDVWDLCWFGDQLYVATMNDLYTLSRSELIAVDFGKLDPPTCYSLTQADGVMWSIGRDDVLSFDGTQWTAYD